MRLFLDRIYILVRLSLTEYLFCQVVPLQDIFSFEIVLLQDIYSRKIVLSQKYLFSGDYSFHLQDNYTPERGPLQELFRVSAAPYRIFILT
jgi:hypothetical protein